MTPKTFIEKAIEGGYELPNSFDRYSYGGCGDDHKSNIDTVKEINVGTFGHAPVAEILLDPLAWQAVGKVEGWSENREKHYSEKKDVMGEFIEVANAGRHKCNKYCAKKVYHGVEWIGQEWLYYMHRMIDALAEGKDVESLLKTL